MPRRITNRMNNLDPGAHSVLVDAARVHNRKHRRFSREELISEGWYRLIRKVEAVSPVLVHPKASEGGGFFCGSSFYTRKQLFGHCLQCFRVLVRNRWRQLQRERTSSDILELLDSTTVTEEPLTDLMAEEYLQMLDTRDRVLIYLRFWKGCSWKEIGVVFGISGTAVHSRYEKIISYLRRRCHADS